jgi:hypothetical protein
LETRVRLVDGIRTVGFRKWYQRELTRSHLSLVVLLLSGIGALVMLELASRHAPMSDRIGSFVLLLACTALGAGALRRYLFLLMRAERAAREAVCPACATYGRLDLAGQDTRSARAEVRCRSCRHVWSMTDAGDP